MKLMDRLLSLFKRKPQRQLPLDHVFTFNDGTKLFTYKAEHYGQISSRHYRNIQEAVNYLMTFQMARPEWIAAIGKMDEQLDYAINETKQSPRTKALVECKMIIKDFRDRAAGLKNANQTLLEYLFCTFYLIDDECEMGFSEVHNKRKIELLNEDPLLGDFFLTNLHQNMKSWFPISEESTLDALVQLATEKERIYSSLRESLKKQTSTSASTQEQTPKP